jgi:hypothetical protein
VLCVAVSGSRFIDQRFGRVRLCPASVSGHHLLSGYGYLLMRLGRCAWIWAAIFLALSSSRSAQYRNFVMVAPIDLGQFGVQRR